VGERRCGPVNPRSDRGGQRQADEDAERSEKREVLVSDEVCDSGRHEERGERLTLICRGRAERRHAGRGVFAPRLGTDPAVMRAAGDLSWMLRSLGSVAAAALALAAALAIRRAGRRRLGALAPREGS